MAENLARTMPKFQPLRSTGAVAPTTFQPPAATKKKPTAPPATAAAEEWEVLYAKKGPKKRPAWHDGVLRRVGSKVELVDANGMIVSRTSSTATLAAETEDDQLFAGYRLQIVAQVGGRQAVAPQQPALATRQPLASLQPALACSATRVPVKKRPQAMSAPGRVAVKKKTAKLAIKAEPVVILESPRVALSGLVAAKLRPHQLTGVRFLYECLSGRNASTSGGGSGAILADDMGLGKTLTTWTLLRVLCKAAVCENRDTVCKRVRKAAILCPATLVQNWVDENSKWFGRVSSNVAVIAALEKAGGGFVGRNETAKDAIGRWAAQDARTSSAVLVVSYETCLRHQTTVLDNVQLDALVLDEGHRLKNTASKMAVAIRGCRARKRLLVTGTPAMNNLDEFWSLADLVNPGALGSHADFRQTVVKVIEAGSRRGRTDDDVERAETAVRDVRKRVETWFLRRGAADVKRTSLPSKTEHIVCCRLTPEQADAYKSACRAASAADPLETISRLRTLSTRGPPGVDAPSGKLQVLCALVAAARAQSDRLVLVSTSTQTLDTLEDLCRARAWKFARLDGSTPADERGALVAAFNRATNQDLFLLSSRAGGAGINLVGANRLVLVDADWNPATDEQAMARVWRDGQTKPVHVYRLLSTGTVDERILQRQLAKHDLADGVVDGTDSRGRFDADELRDIFTYDQTSDSTTFDSFQAAQDTTSKLDWPVYNSPDYIESDDVLRQAALGTGLVTYVRSALQRPDGTPPVVLRSAAAPDVPPPKRLRKHADDDDDAQSSASEAHPLLSQSSQRPPSLPSPNLEDLCSDSDESLPAKDFCSDDEGCDANVSRDPISPVHSEIHPPAQRRRIIVDDDDEDDIFDD